jgi:hypothetical protein
MKTGYQLKNPVSGEMALIVPGYFFAAIYENDTARLCFHPDVMEDIRCCCNRRELSQAVQDGEIEEIEFDDSEIETIKKLAEANDAEKAKDFIFNLWGKIENGEEEVETA